MREIVLKIAVVSDLHCHPKRSDYDKDRTYLFSDKLRTPSKEHPVQNLIETIKEDSFNVDLILSPGDITDQSDIQGFLSGWSFMKEISYALDCNEIIGTIGNHDVDSRNIKSNYSFDIAKKIKQNYPIKEEQIGTFWDKGYTFVENDDYQILVLNSAHYHTHSSDKNDGNPIVKGKVDKGSIEEIEAHLKTNNDTEKIKIFLCHHHPVQHSKHNLGEHDFIENGEELVDLLGKYRFDLIVHGHKHNPLLRYHNTSYGYEIPILSAGSFSATEQVSYISKFNYFHVLQLKKTNGKSFGKVHTWSYQNKVGWKKNENIGFYPYTGFGNLDNLTDMANEIDNYIKSTLLKGDRPLITWNTLTGQFPKIENLTPDKIDELQNLLEERKIYTNPNIGLNPKHIYKDE